MQRIIYDWFSVQQSRSQVLPHPLFCGRCFYDAATCVLESSGNSDQWSQVGGGKLVHELRIHAEQITLANWLLFASQGCGV